MPEERNMSRSHAYIIASLVGLLMFEGCGKQDNVPNIEVLATIDDVKITKADYLRRNQRQMGKFDEQKVHQLLNDMIRDEALMTRAEAVGLTKDPVILDAFRKIVVGKLLERELQPLLDNVSPSEAEIEAYVAVHPNEFRKPERRRGAWIFKAVNKGLSAQRIAALKQQVNEIRKIALVPMESKSKPQTRGLGALAVKHSEDQVSRYKGGDMGWMEAGKAHARYESTVIDTLFQLTNENPVSEVIETTNGIFFVKLLEIQPSDFPAMESVKPALTRKLRSAKQSALRQDYYESARAAVSFKIHQNVLNTLTKQLMSQQSASEDAKPPMLK